VTEAAGGSGPPAAHRGGAPLLSRAVRHISGFGKVHYRSVVRAGHRRGLRRGTTQRMGRSNTADAHTDRSDGDRGGDLIAGDHLVLSSYLGVVVDAHGTTMTIRR